MNPRTIHETELASIALKILNGIETIGGSVEEKRNSKRKTSIGSAYSLTRATEAMTLVFPTLVDGSLSVDTASMISKAVERKCVNLMQIALSAFSMNADVDNVVDFIRTFHTNIDTRKLNLDDYIDIANNVANKFQGIGESVDIDYRDIVNINQDCKNNLNFTFNDDINETSLNDFLFTRIGGSDIISENRDDVKDKQWGMKYGYTKARDKKRDEQREEDNQYKKQRDQISDRQNDKNFELKNRTSTNQYFQNQLISSDVKKSNELSPSLMVVNFMCKGPTNELVSQQSVIGVKSKLYVVESEAIVNKVITKVSDSNLLMKLVKVGTREISFFKDFLLAIDRSKIEVLSKSKKGSSTKLFKVLERRALKGKVRRVLGSSVNDCKPIFSLAISKQSADYLLDYNNIDVERPEVVIPLMERLNLMYFIIIDESNETARFLIDGDSEFETLAFSSLERETTDGGYKKVVNLISKVAR